MGPGYNIRAVERFTGVPAPTLRSWERRYGFPRPSRSPTARRVYSDEDVRAILRVRERMAQGFTAAQAISWVAAGEPRDDQPVPTLTHPTSPEMLVHSLVNAVRRYDERGVESAFATAFARFPADVVLLDIMAPALVRVGAAWADGDLPVAGEHFFSNLVRRRLLGLLAAQPDIASRATAALACLPGEQHELGLMMLAVFLRWSGLRVLYLGADVPVLDVVRLVSAHELDIVCLSAGKHAHWSALRELADGLASIGRPVRIYLGGAAAAERVAPAGVQVITDDLRTAAALIAAADRGA